MDKKLSTEIKFYGGHGVYLEIAHSRWPWWELEWFNLMYFHPWFFWRTKVSIGPIGIGLQIRIGGRK